jgi:hypothetical protein
VSEFLRVFPGNNTAPAREKLRDAFFCVEDECKNNLFVEVNYFNAQYEDYQL